MLKLIASDLDGTLLQNGVRTLSDTVIEQIKQLKEMGILFVAASGRQYTNLQRLFAPVCEDIAYVCENGALVVYKGKILHKNVFERELAEEMLHSILKKDRAELVVSGERTVYLQPKTEAFREYMINFVKNDTTVLPDIFRCRRKSLRFPYMRKTARRPLRLTGKGLWQQSHGSDFRDFLAGYDAFKRR